MRRRLRGRVRGVAKRPDDSLHRRRAEVAAAGEADDIDALLDAINERRRRTGRREIGEEISDELLRGTWES